MIFAFLADYFSLFRVKILRCVYLNRFSARFAFYIHFAISPGFAPRLGLCSRRLISGKDWGHGILAKREDGFSAQVFAGGLGNAAALGFLAIGKGDGLGGTGDHLITPHAIMITGAIHAINLTNFKLLHFTYFLSVPGAFASLALLTLILYYMFPCLLISEKAPYFIAVFCAFLHVPMLCILCYNSIKGGIALDQAL